MKLLGVRIMQQNLRNEKDLGGKMPVIGTLEILNGVRKVADVLCGW